MWRPVHDAIGVPMKSQYWCRRPDLSAGEEERPSMTLPLKATVFERYMRKDDRASHPMTYTIRLKFLGKVDRVTFDAAVDRGVRRHPLLCAHLVGDRPHQLTWVQAIDPFPYIDYGDEAKPFRFSGTERATKLLPISESGAYRGATLSSAMRAKSID